MNQLWFRPVQHLKMTVWTSVWWKMAKNWLEMVEKWLFILQHLFFHYRRVLLSDLLVFNLCLCHLIVEVSSVNPNDRLGIFIQSNKKIQSKISRRRFLFPNRLYSRKNIFLIKDIFLRKVKKSKCYDRGRWLVLISSVLSVVYECSVSCTKVHFDNISSGKNIFHISDVY